MELKTITITFVNSMSVSAAPNEAFAILTMPCFAGLVVDMVPEYGLPSVPEPENKE